MTHERVAPAAPLPRRPGAPHPRLPALLAWATRLADRHLDADAGAGVAGAPVDRLAAGARHGGDGAVHADPALLALRRRAGRSRLEAPVAAYHADGDARPGHDAGAADLDGSDPTLADLCPGARARDRQCHRQPDPASVRARSRRPGRLAERRRP